MLFTAPKKIDSELKIKLNANNIYKIDYVKCLGYKIDKKLSPKKKIIVTWLSN